jgi:hypothetical protein
MFIPRLIVHFVLVLTLLTSLIGCAYNAVTISAFDGSYVSCTSAVDKPTTVNPSVQGNVPVQGGSVVNPTQSVGK